VAEAANAAKPLPAAAAPIAVPLSPGIIVAKPPPKAVIPLLKTGKPAAN